MCGRDPLHMAKDCPNAGQADPVRKDYREGLRAAYQRRHEWLTERNAQRGRDGRGRGREGQQTLPDRTVPSDPDQDPVRQYHASTLREAYALRREQQAERAAQRGRGGRGGRGRGRGGK